MTEIDKINLKNYIGKKVIVFHRNLKKVVNYITYDSQYHDYPYGFNYRRYTKDGKILIDNENGWDISKIFMIQINKDKMTEIEKTKKEIEVLTKKLSFLEELEQTKSPAEKAFKEFYGAYPITDIADTSWDSDGWVYFEAGYNAAQKDYKVGDHQEPIPEEEHKTLYQMIRENDWSEFYSNQICDTVKKWIFQYDCDYATCEDYLEGYIECQTVLEERLR